MKIWNKPNQFLRAKLENDGLARQLRVVKELPLKPGKLRPHMKMEWEKLTFGFYSLL